MTCVCGTKMCYICRAVIQGYDHFSNATEDGKCILMDDNVNENDVRNAERRILQEIRSNPQAVIDKGKRKADDDAANGPDAGQDADADAGQDADAEAGQDAGQDADPQAGARTVPKKRRRKGKATAQ